MNKNFYGYCTNYDNNSMAYQVIVQDVDITSIIFSVKADRDDPLYAFQKTLDNGITLNDTLSYRVRIDSEDTQNLPEGKYYYDIEVTLGSEDVYTIMMGSIILEQEITKR